MSQLVYRTLLIVLSIFVILFSYFKQKNLSDFVCFIPFSKPVNFDVEKILKASYQQHGCSFSCTRTDSIFLITSGVEQIIVSVENEILSQEFVDHVISSSRGLSENEVNQIKLHQAFVSIRTQGVKINSKEKRLFIFYTLLALLKEDGAVGYANHTISNFYPVSRFQVYMDKTVFQPEELKSLFVND